MKYHMASCATPVIYVWCFRCITCIEIQVYYMCSRCICNTHVPHNIIHVYMIYTCSKHVFLQCNTCVGYNE